MSDRDNEESRRTVARRARRDAGTDSARLASTLMELPGSALAKLGLDEDLAAELARARAVTALGARRRAERTLAGALRKVDLADLARRLERVRSTGVVDTQRLHQAERWRTRILDEPDAAAAFAASFPDADPDALARLVADAQRERTTGRPPGAARALFRHINAAVEAAARAAAEAAAQADDDDDD